MRDKSNHNMGEDKVHEDIISLIKICNHTSIDSEAALHKERIKEKIFSRIASVGNIAETKPKVNVVSLKFAKWYFLAASIVLLLSLSSIGYLYSNYIFFDVKNIAKVEVISPYSAITTIYLPDSTKVVLNANSKLTYPALFTTNNKEIVLEGEAFFDVRKQKDTPLIVKSDLLKTYVIGTKFNVKSYPNDDKIELTLLEGNVVGEILKEDNVQQVSLNPNQQLIIDKAGVDFSRIYVNAEESALWTTGSLSLRYVNLKQIANILERRYHVKLTIDSSTVNQEDKYLATFNENLTIEEILEILSYKRNWYYVKTTEGYHIYLK